jgi:hypothetical protein
VQDKIGFEEHFNIRQFDGDLPPYENPQRMIEIRRQLLDVAEERLGEMDASGGGAADLIVSGDTLAYATLLITGARLGDLRGRRRTYMIGLAAFSGVLGHLTQSVGPRYAPDVSGLFNTTLQVGGTIGTAVFGAIYLGHLALLSSVYRRPCLRHYS